MDEIKEPSWSISLTNDEAVLIVNALREAKAPQDFIMSFIHKLNSQAYANNPNKSIH